VAKPTKHKAPALDPNLTDRDAVAMLRKLGSLQRRMEAVVAHGASRIAAIQEATDKGLAPIRAEADEVEKTLRAYAEKHRERLCGKGRKLARLATGEFIWRKNPPKVSIRKAEEVLAALKTLGLKRFVRVKEEINKEAILDDPAAVAGVKGVTVSATETLEIKPFALKETDA